MYKSDIRYYLQQIIKIAHRNTSQARTIICQIITPVLKKEYLISTHEDINRIYIRQYDLNDKSSYLFHIGYVLNDNYDDYILTDIGYNRSILINDPEPSLRTHKTLIDSLINQCMIISEQTKLYLIKESLNHI